MISLIYLGNDITTMTRLKYLPGQTVKCTSSYKEAAKWCSEMPSQDNAIILFDKRSLNEDITAITYLHNNYREYTLSYLQHRFQQKNGNSINVAAFTTH